MVCATKEVHDWINFWTYLAFFMQIGMNIWFKEYLQVDMCLTYLEEKSVG